MITISHNSKIITAVTLSTLIIAFSVFYMVQSWFASQFDVNKVQQEFYSKLASANQKKIFLIGTSHVAVLNATYIQDYVDRYDKQYTVYNLAILGDRITERFTSVNDIISAKPDLVVYGVGFRDFENPVINNNTADFFSVSNVASPLLDPHTHLQNLFSNIGFIDYNFASLHNPQLLTLKAIGSLTNKPFPIPDHTLIIIWEDRVDLQKAFPEVAQGNLDRLKKWAATYGWINDQRLSSLKPQLDDILIEIWHERPDLQKAFPEVAQGNLDMLKKWAATYGYEEDARLSSLSPPTNSSAVKSVTKQVNSTDTIILNNSELETLAKKDPFYGFDPNYMNKNIVALNGFVNELQKNKIKIVIFTTPSSRAYLDTIPATDESSFVSIFEDIEKKYHVKVYYLHDKYADMNIWQNPTHVARNEKAIIYSDDIAKIITNELAP